MKRPRNTGIIFLSSFVLFMSSCGVTTEKQASLIKDVPFGLSENSTSTTSTTIAATPSSLPGEVVTFFYILNDRLIPVRRQIPLAASVQFVLNGLSNELPKSEISPFARSALPPRIISTVEVTRGLAVVDTDASLLSIDSSIDQRLAIGQIVLTLTSLPGVGQVLFTVDGTPQAVPRGGGDVAKANQPVAYDDYVSLIGPIDGEFAFVP